MKSSLAPHLVPKVLVAGIGNIFKADDGFGVEVAQRLLRADLPERIHVEDFGIRGLDLAYALLDGQYDGVILVDLVRRGGAPGALYVLEIDPHDFEKSDDRSVLAETHGMHPVKVLSWVKAMGGTFPALRLVGCEPEDACEGEEDLRMGLSEPVTCAVEEAVSLVGTLISEFFAESSNEVTVPRRRYA